MRNLWRNAGAYIALVVVVLIFAVKLPEFRQAQKRASGRVVGVRKRRPTNWAQILCGAGPTPNTWPELQVPVIPSATARSVGKRCG